MKNVVITGSARGFGYAMAEEFAMLGINVVLCDVNKELLEESKNKLQKKYPNVKVMGEFVDVTKIDTINELIENVIKELGKIDFWINNAGVNQPDKAIWDLDEKDIDKLLNIDLKGTIMCSKAIVPVMAKNGGGQIFNVEGYGSNDATMLGLSIYGTSKRAVTYFTEALSKECSVVGNNVLVGKITPGIMITNFINTSMGDGEKIDLPEKTKKVYNILGDYPETIAHFMVPRMVNNTKNGVKLVWLTGRRAAWRFMMSGFNKRDFFSK